MHRSHASVALGRTRHNAVSTNACASDPLLHCGIGTTALGIFGRVRGLTIPYDAPVGRVARATASRGSVARKRSRHGAETACGF
jgi:hypothetical protein